MTFTRPPLGILLPLLQLPLILNPGYFSHDELQWWARADVATWTQLPWVSWLDLSPLQYRPLTFNLWLILAHAFAATPRLMHLVFVLLGTANACLLARVLSAARIPGRVAYAAAVVFSICPYAVYVHGWTGTLADLLTLGFGLLAVRCVQHAAAAPQNPTAPLDATALKSALAAALLVAAALLSKESAIVLPALLSLAAFRQASMRAVRLAVASAAVVVAAYLAVRLPILVDSAHANSAYAWSLAHVPARLTEYLLFPFMPPLFEIAPLLSKGAGRLGAAAACLAALLLALSMAGKRWPFVWLAAFALALAPVLVLAMSYDHYAYLASAVAVAIVAAAWPEMRRGPRVAIAALAAIVVVHGAIVMSRLYAVGVVQKNLYADLLADLDRHPGQVTITAADARDAWLVGRLLHDVERYRGVPLAGRLISPESGEPRTDIRKLSMDREGRLHPDDPT